jgi:ABC-type bacteriocin/lantibiotic exporter with double-glycine peptidase domain
MVQNLYEMLDSVEFDYKWSIVKLVMKTFKFELINIIVLGCLVECLSLGNVFLTSFLVDWIKDEDSPLWLGLLYVLVIGGILLSALILRQQYFFYGKMLGINLRKSVSGMIYK